MVTPSDSDTLRQTSDASPMQSLAFLWRGRWLIAGVAVLCAAAGVFYAEQRGTIWRAKSVLYVQRKSSLMPGSDVSLWLESRNYAMSQAPQCSRLVARSPAAPTRKTARASFAAK